VSATLVWIGRRAYDRWRATRDVGPPSTDGRSVSSDNASFGMLVALSIVGALLHVGDGSADAVRDPPPQPLRLALVQHRSHADCGRVSAGRARRRPAFGRQSPAARQRNAAIVLVLMAANYGLRAVEHAQALATVPQLFGPTLAPPCDPQPA
jgi:hypothetical protein